MVEYQLRITQLEVVQLESQPNTVCTVHYDYKGTADDGRVHSYFGSEELSTENIESFVSFDDLTEATVIGWLEDVWWEGHYQHMKDTINQHFNAPVVTSPRAPWEPEAIPGVNAP